MFDPCLPDLEAQAWRAVRASALDAIQLAARKGQAAMRVHGVQLCAQRLCTSEAALSRSAMAPPLPAFVQLSVRRGSAPAEIVFVFAAMAGLHP